MKRFAAITCLFTLVWNISLASVGGTFICAHEDGEEHWIIPSETSENPFDSCCSDQEYDHLKTAASEDSDCGPCVDIEVNTPDLENANANSQRIAIKTPLAIDWSPFVLEKAPIFPLYCLSTAPIRSPPFCNGASQEFSSSIRILC